MKRWTLAVMMAASGLVACSSDNETSVPTPDTQADSTPSEDTNDVGDTQGSEDVPVPSDIQLDTVEPIEDVPDSQEPADTTLDVTADTVEPDTQADVQEPEDVQQDTTEPTDTTELTDTTEPTDVTEPFDTTVPEGCHGLTLNEPAVPFTQVTSLPTMSGGLIPPGTYHIQSVELTSSLTGSLAAIWRFNSNNTVDVTQVLTLSGASAATPRTYNYRTEGNRLLREEVCPSIDGTDFDNEYTVSGNTLLIRQSTLLFRFTRID